MSKETLEYLNSGMVLVGQSSKRGKAWWHRRALDVPGRELNHYEFEIPVADVRRRLFNWTAEERRVAVEQPADIQTMTSLDDDGHPVRYVTMADRKAIVASDNEDVLGVFKSGYQPHQYDQWLVSNVETLLDGDLSISSAGLLRNRAVAWVEVSVPDNIETPQGVTFRPNLLAATSLDGSLATTYKRTITNVVCDNTMAIALQERGGQVKFRHSKNSIGRIADARMALDIIYTAAGEFAAQVKAPTEQTITDAQWQKILGELVPLDPDSKRATTIGSDKREQLTAMYRSDPRVAPWTGTAFGVWQAFNTWGQHEQATRGDTVRAERNMLGTLTGDIEKSDRLVLAALGAGVGQLFGDGGIGLASL